MLRTALCWLTIGLLGMGVYAQAAVASEKAPISTAIRRIKPSVDEPRRLPSEDEEAVVRMLSGQTAPPSDSIKSPKRTASLLNLNQPPRFSSPVLEEQPLPDPQELIEPRPGTSLFAPPALESESCSRTSNNPCVQGCCNCGSYCGGGDPQCQEPRWIDNFSMAQTMDGFKGPLDLNSANGNFGTRTTINGAMSLLPKLGLSGQLGTALGWYDLKGTPFTGPQSRFQSFTTVGIFQSLMEGNVRWGVAYDFLYDAYYKNFNFGQWRAKAGWWVNDRNELGVWGTLAGYGDAAVMNAAGNTNQFRPITQANLYWQHLWQGGISTQSWFGAAEKPGELVFGADMFAPLNRSLAMVGNFNYITAAGGPRNNTSRGEEFWNVSFGIAWYPGANATRAARSRTRPFMPVADNGSFAVTRDF